MPLLSDIAKGAVGSAVKGQSRGRGLLRLGAGLIATRIATRSLPGAAIVGGLILAKAIYDRRQDKAD